VHSSGNSYLSNGILQELGLNVEASGLDNIAPLDNSPSATPLPATLPLFAGGLGFVGYLTRRKKRNAHALAAA
jgi:hypothetical protein